MSKKIKSNDHDKKKYNFLKIMFNILRIALILNFNWVYSFDKPKIINMIEFGFLVFEIIFVLLFMYKSV